jgi:hypothetical protein
MRAEATRAARAIKEKAEKEAAELLERSRAQVERVRSELSGFAGALDDLKEEIDDLGNIEIPDEIPSVASLVEAARRRDAESEEPRKHLWHR